MISIRRSRDSSPRLSSIWLLLWSVGALSAWLLPWAPLGASGGWSMPLI